MNALENVFQGQGGQIDLLNTLYGGSSQTRMNVEREADRLVLDLAAPGVQANSFNVLIEGNKLVIYTLLVQHTDEANHRLAVPMFLKIMDIPPFVDAEQIEAVHAHAHVKVLMPFKSEEQLHRRVDIQDEF
jgi:HSP20 family protein